MKQSCLKWPKFYSYVYDFGFHGEFLYYGLNPASEAFQPAKNIWRKHFHFYWHSSSIMTRFNTNTAVLDKLYYIA